MWVSTHTPSIPPLTVEQQDTGLYNFSNIRFAQNPVGPLRFSAPQPPTGRLEDVQVGEKGRICPQSGPEWSLVSAQFSEAVAKGEAESFNMTEAVEIAKQQIADGALPSPHADGSTYITEDCLFLDVIVPSAVFDKGERQHEGHPAERAPVVVWYDVMRHVCPDLNANVWAAPGFMAGRMFGGTRSTRTAVIPAG